MMLRTLTLTEQLAAMQAAYASLAAEIAAEREGRIVCLTTYRLLLARRQHLKGEMVRVHALACGAEHCGTDL